MKKTILIASFSLLLGACATNGTTATADSAASAIAAAQAAKGKAAEAGYEWRDTGKIIEKAQKAAEAKEYTKAAELAALAERQSVAALKQHEEQKNASSMN